MLNNHHDACGGGNKCNASSGGLHKKRGVYGWIEVVMFFLLSLGRRVENNGLYGMPLERSCSMLYSMFCHCDIKQLHLCVLAQCHMFRQISDARR